MFEKNVNIFCLFSEVVENGKIRKEITYSYCKYKVFFPLNLTFANPKFTMFFICFVVFILFFLNIGLAIQTYFKIIAYVE